ncbi:MAG: T9SS type A sorting domain-containing protein [Melioribacteraceae bacterium]|nr:T9SS type A sorting domain-containing protein [Melioribacteraceae bacterium]
MRNIFYLLIVFLLAEKSIAQNFNVWNVHADLKNVNALLPAENGFAGAASGGVFFYNKAEDAYKNLSKASGLSSQNYTAGNIDSQGRYWFGSTDGFINIYNPKDGSIQRIIDIAKTDKNQKQINHIFIKGDTVLVSSSFGLSLINAKSLVFMDTFLKLGSFSAEGSVYNSYKSTLIYVVTENGIAVQKPGATNLSAPESWGNFRLNSDIAANSVKKVFEYKSKMYAVTSNGIFVLTDNRWQKFLFDTRDLIDAVVQGENIYAITSNILFKYDGSTSSVLYENYALAFNTLAIIENQVHLGTTNGILKLTGSQPVFYKPNSPATNSFLNMSISPEGKLYAATGKDARGVGVLEFDGDTWSVYDISNTPQFITNDFYNVYAAKDSSVIMTNWGQGFAILKNGKVENYTWNNSGMVGIPKDQKFIVITDAKKDSKGNLWVTNLQSGAQRPLTMMTKDKQFFHFGFSAPLINEFDLVDKLVIDNNDTKWFTVTVGDAGLYYFNENNTPSNLNDDTRGYISRNDGLASDVPTSLAIDRRGYLWVGTSAGINIIFDTKRPNLKTPGSTVLSMRNQSVTCIAVDPVDQKWVGTKDGLFLLSSDGTQVLKSFNSSNSPIPNNEIKSLAINPANGLVYIGTDYGVALLSTTFIEPKESFGEINVYPNPFMINGSNSIITIDGLIRDSEIKVLDVTGKLIRSLLTPGGRVATWDVKDNDGNYVNTGIYIFVIHDKEANSVATAKVAVIRK